MKTYLLFSVGFCLADAKSLTLDLGVNKFT
jgi:hypothetical protein